MTDTAMEESIRFGNAEDVVVDDKPLSIIKRVGLWTAILIINSIKLTAVGATIVLVAYLAVTILTPDPWYVRINPF